MIKFKTLMYTLFKEMKISEIIQNIFPDNINENTILNVIVFWKKIILRQTNTNLIACERELYNVTFKFSNRALNSDYDILKKCF